MASVLEDYEYQKRTNQLKKPTTSVIGTPVPAKVTPVVTMGSPNNGLFVGPIPTGSTRTVTGYTTPAGTTVTVNPTTAPVVPVIPGGNPVVNDLKAAKDRILASTLSAYGLDGIDKVIAQIRSDFPEIDQDDLLTLLKTDPKYNSLYVKRFAGNAKRIAAGIAPLSDADYLAAEKEYEKIFTAYDTPTLKSRDYYATLIANRMDASDVADRLDLGYQVYKGNPNIKNAFNKFYGTVTDGDVVAAMLDPMTQVPLLKKKITVAEIGGAALQQNLKTSLVSAQDLEAYGVTGAAAQSGYATIAQNMTPYEKLLEISGGKDVKAEAVQTKLEAAKFKNSAEEQLAIEAERQKEINRFSGSAGRLASKNRAQGLI